MASIDPKEEMTSQVEQEESAAGKPSRKPTFASRVKSHYKRFWWLHLIILIVLVLVITLPIVYVLFPHKAQSQVDAASVNLTALALTNPSPTMFTLALTNVLTTHSSYHPQLQAFNATLALKNVGVPFTSVTIPHVHSENGVVVHINQTSQVLNLTAFTQYVETALGSESYQIEVNGRMPLKEMKLPETTVNYNKTVTTPGLNRLNGFNITSFQILLAAAPDGANMIGTALIPNPTVMTLELGNVTTLLSAPDAYNLPVALGTALIPDLTLVPGPNSVPMRATVNQTAVLDLLHTTYKDGIVPLEILGDTVVFEGQHLSYYETALKQNLLHVDLNVGAALKAAGLGALLPNPGKV